MENPNDSQEYLQSVQQALESVTIAAKDFQSIYTSETGEDVRSLCAKEAKRRALVLEAYKFLQIAQGPIDAAAPCFEQTAHVGTVRSLLEMGIFDELPLDGTPRTTKELSETLQVNESLLGRLLRHASLYGPLEQTGPDSYRQTSFSKVFRRPEIKGMLRFSMDDHMPAHLKLHEHLQLKSWESPSSPIDNPYTHTHQTGGKSMFANLSANPKRLQAFNDAMTLQTLELIWMIDLFPFNERLSAANPTSNTILAVDVGGGKGEAIARIRSLAGDVPGRFILEDRADVIASLGSAAHLQGIQTLGYDFFTPQPVHGALIYLIRRCLHNWPETSVVQILKNIAGAMAAHSRLLIEEIIVPEQNSGIEEGWMDLIMMSIGAKQRTLEEWRGVLGLAGLELVDVHQCEGYCHGLLEAKVKQ
ncbi:O-methyltransferase [Aspergillus stella-maris]|uniref:O-methyltransferase n=1 Tax=Aspergillus stella-maris TaxID=1810926 RepID=UPI003CCD0D71